MSSAFGLLVEFCPGAGFKERRFIMANVYAKKRYKIKYKNLALLLAIFLLLILLISRGCSAIFQKKDKDPLQTLSSDDMNSDQSEASTIQMTTDPTLQTSYTFDSVKKTAADLGEGDLVLVNNKIKYLGEVTDEGLDVVREKKNSAYAVKDYTVLVRPEVMDALNRMMLDFYNATGKDGVMVNAGYRTLEYQQELYDADLKSTGSDTSTLVAMPGYSEHHTGLAIDFTVVENGKYDQSKINQGDYLWIYENSYKYGFVNRYPEGKQSLTMIDNEPWHFRYVGVAHATAMHNLDYCLEEYIEYLKNFTVSTGFLSIKTDDGSTYITYFTPQSKEETTDIYLPKKSPSPQSKELYPYEISGNNIDGWIVTFLYEQGAGSVSPAAPEENEAPVDGNGEGEVTSAPEDDGGEPA